MPTTPLDAAMPTSPLPPETISEEIWRLKYRLTSPDGSAEGNLLETFRRVAVAVAATEAADAARASWADTYQQSMADLGFLPAGRILAGAGTGRAVTLFNCFVMGRIEDDLGAIFDGVKEAALTMQAGGGVGMDFSTLRPKGALVHSIGADASGPVSFMSVWNAMCATIMSAGSRRGAMMATLRADHPDIERFIAAKAERGQLSNFNLSVLVPDALIEAVDADADWNLVFADKIYRTVKARDLWRQIMQATYEYAEPGVIFIDRVNQMNNLAYCETISATNPCGEQPLPPYGACLLGSINLAALVDGPFSAAARLNLGRLTARVDVAARFLDGVIDASSFPLETQRQEAMAKRRIGLGATGLADALAMLGLHYDSEEARTQASSWMAIIADAAYAASARLAAEKGVFPLFDRDAFMASPNVARLSAETRGLIARHGIRNGCLTSIAPTGTISMLAGNVSSGIEPIYALAQRRRILEADGSRREEVLNDFAYAAFRRLRGNDAAVPEALVTAHELPPAAHLKMQAAVQPFIDSSISKTINVPQDLPFEAFEAVYRDAYALGLKGCTTYRPNLVTGAVLEEASVEQSPGGQADGGQARADPSAPLAADGAAAPSSTHATVAAAMPSNKGPAPTPAAGEARLMRPTPGDVVYMARPLERDSVLTGFTYKLRWPASDHAIYVTINDIMRDGRRRPFEIFINTRNLEHYAWTVALTRMISAVFRRGGDVTFVAEELKAVFDPQGGQWMNGRYVPSLLAAIGEVIERHMREIGFLGADRNAEPLISEPAAEPGTSHAAAIEQDVARANRERDAVTPGKDSVSAGTTRSPRIHFCPRCSSPRLERQEGCWVCRDCGFSRCG